MKALLLSSLVASVLIMVVILPTLCDNRARPLRRSDLRKIAPIIWRMLDHDGDHGEYKNIPLFARTDR